MYKIEREGGGAKIILCDRSNYNIFYHLSFVDISKLVYKFIFFLMSYHLPLAPEFAEVLQLYRQLGSAPM